MAIKHLSGRSKEEIIKAFNLNGLKKRLLDDVDEHTASYFKIIDKTRGADIYRTLVILNGTPFSHPVNPLPIHLSLQECYKDFEEYWNMAGISKEYFGIDDNPEFPILMHILFGSNNPFEFCHDKSAPAYIFMHKIHLMVRRCKPHVKDSDIYMKYVTLSNYAWLAGYKRYMDAYFSVLNELCVEMNKIPR